MPVFTIKARVILEDADVVVEADSAEEAMARARARIYDDIDFDCASVADYDLTGKPKEG